MSVQLTADQKTQLTSLLEIMSSALNQCKPATLTKLNDQAGFQPGTVNDVLAQAQLLLNQGAETEQSPPAELNLLIGKIWQHAISLAGNNQPTNLSDNLPHTEIDEDLYDSSDIDQVKMLVTNLRKQNSHLESQLKTKTNSEQLLQKNLGKSRIEIATLKSSQLNSKMLKDTAEKEKLHADQYHKQFEAAKTEIYHLCKQLEQIKKEQKTQIKESDTKIAELKTQIDTLKAESSKENPEIANQLKRLTEALDASQSQADSLQQKLDERQKSFDKLQTAYKALEETASDLKQTVSHQEKALAEKAQSLAKLEQQLQQLQQSTSSHNETENALKVAQQQVAELEAYKQQSIELEQKLSAAELHSQEFEALEQKLKDEINTLKTESERLASQEQMLAKDISELRKENEALKSQLNSGNKEYEDERKQLSAKLRDYHAISSEREELKRQLDDAESRLANAMQSKEQAVRTRDRIITDIEVMAMQLKDPADKSNISSILKQYQNDE
jgi:chromosome segregation ATPase